MATKPDTSMEGTPDSSQISVLFLAYDTFNTLDIHGPLDVLGNVALSADPFKLTIAAQHDIITSAEGAKIQRHISFITAFETLANYDILIQPGGSSDDIFPHLYPHKNSQFSDMLNIIEEFSQLSSSPRLNGPRIIMSICTGALFLGSAGIFSGLNATTHFLTLPKLKIICDAYTARSSTHKPTTVVPNPASLNFRYVKEQLSLDRKVRVISSGGISCGIDATLYLLALVKGIQPALAVAQMMQYVWREMP
ncbi:d17a1b82-9558-4fc8-822a-e07d8971b37c-CDS [Sclerotinia trifoliorum]|uniref:D17a1b82-9558-4fc8-822a-e07d8971b37c-CDS n=1 Tax=Sclerotinia trifoliorum TaxID=28548 RepID=A0A8H2VWZ3_9HELO|nr:d17a1b82-9558-4fc8-822a-e07d8971b37c-CDS [Sclerotinia trifoliorum]